MIDLIKNADEFFPSVFKVENEEESFGLLEVKSFNTVEVYNHEEMANVAFGVLPQISPGPYGMFGFAAGSNVVTFADAEWYANSRTGARAAMEFYRTHKTYVDNPDLVNSPGIEMYDSVLVIAPSDAPPEEDAFSCYGVILTKDTYTLVGFEYTRDGGIGRGLKNERMHPFDDEELDMVLANAEAQLEASDTPSEEKRTIKEGLRSSEHIRLIRKILFP